MYINLVDTLNSIELEFKHDKSTVPMYKTGYCIFSVYRNQFLVLKLEVYVCLAKSLLILSFLFIKANG